MNAIITLSAGENREFSILNQQTFKRYAEKIGAQFVVYNDFDMPKEYLTVNCARNPKVDKVYVKKMAIIYDALTKYDRVLYLDDSCYISKDCPNLFDFVPENFMAMHNEGMLEFIKDVVNTSNKTITNNNLKEIPRRNYFNSGIILASTKHINIFSSDCVANETNKKLFECNFVDQTYLNYVVQKNHIPFLTLGYLFSKMYVFPTDTSDYADKTWNEILALVKNHNDFFYLNDINVSPGYNNHAFIYHFTSMWSNEQRKKLSIRLQELGV